MAKFMILKINNSKDASIKSGKWKDPGAKLYDQLLNAAYFASDEVDDPRNESVHHYLKETYLIAPINKIKYGPYGQTPYSRSGCKYPHHTIRNGELIVHEGGLRAAYARAKQQGIFTGEVKEHLERHYKELGLYEGSTMAMSEMIEQNFSSIESYIYESAGIDLYSPTELFAEKSHGGLKSSFRRAINVENGHIIKIVFDLKTNDMNTAGPHWRPSSSDILSKINKIGHNNFSSTGTVKAIIDLDTSKRLQSVTAVGILGFFKDGYPDNDRIKKAGTQFYIPDKFRGKASDDEFEKCTLKEREEIAKEIGSHLKGITYTVSKKEEIPTYKSTSGSLITNNGKNGFALGTAEGFQDEFDKGEKLYLKNGSRVKNAKDLELLIKEVNIGADKFKREIRRLLNEFNIIITASQKFPMNNHNKNIFDGFRRDFLQAGKECLISANDGNMSKARDFQNKCIHTISELKRFLTFIKSSNSYKKESVDIYQEATDRLNDIENFIFEQAESPSNRLWVEIDKLPKVYQDLIKESNKMILSKMESLIKNNPEYKRLNEKEIIDELKESMINPKVMGVANLHKNPKSYEGSIFITNADQDYDFYHTDRDKYSIDEVYKPIYPIYLDMMKEIEKELKEKFKEHKDAGITFMLRGDPIDQIHQFEFDLSKEKAEELWNYLSDNSCSKIFRAKLFEESSQYYTEEISMDEFHEVVQEFRKECSIPVLYLSIDEYKENKIRKGALALSSRIDKNELKNNKIKILRKNEPGGIHVILITPYMAYSIKHMNDKRDAKVILRHEYGHFLTFDKITDDVRRDYNIRKWIFLTISKYYSSPNREVEFMIGYHNLKVEKMADDAAGVSIEDCVRTLGKQMVYPENPNNPFLIAATIEIPDIILHVDVQKINSDDEYRKEFSIEYVLLLKKILPKESYEKFLLGMKKTNPSQTASEENNQIKDPIQEAVDYINSEEGLKMESVDSDDIDWIGKYLTEEGEENPQQPVEEKKPPEPKKESMPKKTDRAESDKNGVRRKQLYIAFIEWAKGINPKNTFGSIFDKDAFHSIYPFVPEDMRYFYRLANPMLCVLTGDLTFFAVAELKKLNIKNSRLSELMIFAATKEDLRVFNKKDKKVYRGVEENGMLKLAETLGDTFDTYIQKMINKGDILNAPLTESADIFPPLDFIGRRM